MRGQQIIKSINPLKAQLNPICHLLAFLGAHPILHVSRIRVNFNSRLTFGNSKCSLQLNIISILCVTARSSVFINECPTRCNVHTDYIKILREEFVLGNTIQAVAHVRMLLTVG